MRRHSGLVALGAVALSVALPLAAAGSASAVTAKTATCSDGDSDGTGSTFYTANGNKNTVNWFEVLMTNDNRLGNKNNINIQHKENRTGLPDKVFQEIKADNIKAATNTRVGALSGMTTTKGKAHTRFEFTFDNSLGDDNCHVDTANF